MCIRTISKETNAKNCMPLNDWSRIEQENCYWFIQDTKYQYIQYRTEVERTDDYLCIVCFYFHKQGPRFMIDFITEFKKLVQLRQMEDKTVCGMIIMILFHLRTICVLCNASRKNELVSRDMLQLWRKRYKFAECKKSKCVGQMQRIEEDVCAASHLHARKSMLTFSDGKEEKLTESHQHSDTSERAIWATG